MKKFKKALHCFFIHFSPKDELLFLEHVLGFQNFRHWDPDPFGAKSGTAHHQTCTLGE
jgi:hypothetical protein